MAISPNLVQQAVPSMPSGADPQKSEESQSCHPNCVHGEDALLESRRFAAGDLSEAIS